MKASTTYLACKHDSVFLQQSSHTKLQNSVKYGKSVKSYVFYLVLSCEFYCDNFFKPLYRISDIIMSYMPTQPTLFI